MYSCPQNNTLQTASDEPGVRALTRVTTPTVTTPDSHRTITITATTPRRGRRRAHEHRVLKQQPPSHPPEPAHVRLRLRSANALPLPAARPTCSLLPLARVCRPTRRCTRSGAAACQLQTLQPCQRSGTCTLRTAGLDRS